MHNDVNAQNGIGNANVKGKYQGLDGFCYALDFSDDTMSKTRTTENMTSASKVLCYSVTNK